MSNSNVLAPVKLTPDQNQWLKDESFRTGNSKTVIIRSLIQDKIEGKKK